jgi:enterochelin esterase-like enzyme
MKFLPVIYLWLALSLAACALPPTPVSNPPGIAHAAVEATPTLPPPPTSVIYPTFPPTWTPGTVIPSLTPTLTLTPTPTPCAETRGSIYQLSISSETLGYPIDALIYLPPCYDTSDRSYPVLYLIHGLNFMEDQWERLGAADAADELITAGEIAPLIIVMPRDRLDDRLDEAFVTDLVPAIDRNYRTLTDREHRAIGGLSRGGAWAIHIGLHYADKFGRIGAHSPAIFFGDEKNILKWIRNLPKAQVPAVYIDIGQNDSLVQSAYWFDQVLTYSKIKHTYIFQPGTHSEKYWSAHADEYLRFYAADWLKVATATPVMPDILQ